jgi:hypothetical protein
MENVVRRIPSSRRRDLLSRVAVSAVIAWVLVVAPAAAQTSLTGTWAGTYSYSITLSGCKNMTFVSNGNVAVTFLQNDSSLSGNIDLADVQIFSGTCTPAKGDITSVILGAVSGPNVSWTFPNDSNLTQFVGTDSGDAITATISDASGGSGTLSITRTSGAPPLVDPTGSWSGTYNFTDQCSNGGVQKYSGAFTLGLVQSGGLVSGVATMDNVPLYDQNCNKVATQTLALSTAGTMSGSTLAGAIFEPSGSFAFPVSISVDAATMSGTVNGASQTSTTGTFALTRSSSQPPGADFSGTYQGTYSETNNETSFCLNIGSLTFDGAASVSIVQAGNAISGSLTIEDALDVVQDGFGGCQVVDVGEQTLPLFGNVSGNTLTLILPLGGGVVDAFTVNFAADMLTGTVDDSFGDTLSFSTAKLAVARSTVVRSFSAAPTSILAGQSATLSWSTSDATTVTIDNGLGTQPVSGSVTVSPASTTIYTLTATGPAGSVSARTVVIVSRTGAGKQRTSRP